MLKPFMKARIEMGIAVWIVILLLELASFLLGWKGPLSGFPAE